MSYSCHTHPPHDIVLQVKFLWPSATLCWHMSSHVICHSHRGLWEELKLGSIPGFPERVQVPQSVMLQIVCKLGMRLSFYMAML